MTLHVSTKMLTTALSSAMASQPIVALTNLTPGLYCSMQFRLCKTQQLES